MKRVLKHLLESLLILLCIISINFLMIRFMPGDPLVHIIGENEYLYLSMNKPEVIEEIRAQYGLDKPFATQYVIYLAKTARLDFGNSYRIKTPVLETVLFRLRWTLTLAIPATLLAAAFGGWLGLRAGWQRGGRLDSLISPVMLFISTIPGYCTAIIFLLIFAFRLGMFPISGITSGGLSGFAKTVDILWHMVLPLTILTLNKTSGNYMLMRGAVISIRDEEYITTALAKGLKEARVCRGHLLKNALCPYIASVCMQFGFMVSGAMMIELVFSWPGMGTLISEAVFTKDYPMLQTCFLFAGICIVVFNLVADLINMAIDPRIREDLRDA